MHRRKLILFSAKREPVLRAALALAALLALSLPAAAQSTWTGDYFGVWNQALNWSPTGIPNSPMAVVNFTGNNIGAVNISSSVQTQSLNFSNPTGAYTLTSSAGVSLSSVTAINVAAGVTGTQTINLANVASGSLRFPALNNLTITNNSTAAGTTLVIGPNTVISTPGTGGVVINGTGTTEISGGLSAPSPNRIVGGLIKSGPGTLILSNPTNNYGGGTFVNGGTLRLGSGTALPTGSDVLIHSGAQLNTNGLSNTPATAIGLLDFNGGTLRVPSGSGDYWLRDIAMTGGTVDFTGTSNFWLHLTGIGAGISTNATSTTASWIGGGNSRIVNDGPFQSFITVNAGTTPNGIDLDAGIRLANGIDNQGFIKAGAGTMRLTNLGNTADFLVSAGNLRVDDLSTGGVGALGSGVITLTLGALQYGGPSGTTTKNLTLGASDGKIQVLTPGANLNYNGVITTTGGSQGLFFLGPGAGNPSSTLTLGGNNFYNGFTAIDANAIVAIPTISNAGQPSPIGADLGGTGLALGETDSRGTLMLTGTNSSYSTNRSASVHGNYDIDQAGGAIGVQNAGTNLTWNGQITGVGSGSFIKTGAGTLTLTNATNDYAGGTYVEEGTLIVASGAVIPANTDVTVSPSATFQLGFPNASNTVAPLRTLTLNGGALRASAGDVNYYLNKLVMTGGTVDFFGASFAGLYITGASPTIITNASATTATWIPGSASQILNATSGTMTISVARGATASGIDLDAGIPLSVPFGLESGTSFVKVGLGTMRVTGGITGGLLVQQGTVRVDDLGKLNSGDLTLNGGRLAYGGVNDASLSKPFTVDASGGGLDVLNAGTTLTLTSPVTSNGVLNKSGPGVLVLSNTANAYQGGIAVSGGRIDVGDDAQLGQAAVTVNPFGVLRYTASTTTAARTFTLNGGSIEAAAGAGVSMNGASVGGGFLRGPGAFNLAGGTALTGVTTLTSTTINQTGAASVANFTNGGSFTVAAGQTLAANGITNTSSGRLVLNGAANVTDFVSSGLITINAGGALANSGAPLTLGGGSRTFIGSAAVPGGAINLGGQTLELNGGLLVNNGMVSGTVNVNFGSVVKGAGAYGVVNVNQGGVYAPGNSPGVSNAAAVEFENTSSNFGGPSLEIELAGLVPGNLYDQLHVTGQLSLGGTLSVSLIDGFTPAAGNSFDILDWGSLSGTFSSIALPALGNMLAWNTSQLYMTGVLSVVDGIAYSADFDEDGDVDGDDLAQWAGDFAENSLSDADDDGDSDGADFLAWQRQLGSVPAVAAAAVVPEPGTFLLFVVAAAGLRRTACRKRQELVNEGDAPTTDCFLAPLGAISRAGRSPRPTLGWHEKQRG